jgi:hypothetical protein
MQQLHLFLKHSNGYNCTVAFKRGELIFDLQIFN